MIRNIFLLYPLILVLASCGKNKSDINFNYKDKAETVKISLNNTRWEFSDFFEVKKAITLDYLLAEINKLIFYNESIYILDQKHKSILKFSENGRLQQRYYAFGKGPKEYLDIIDFDIDNKNGNIIILDGIIGKQLVIYDNSGQFISKQPLSFGCSNFYKTKNGYVFYCGNHQSKENRIDDNYFHNVIYCDTNMQVTNKQIPISTIWNGRRYIFKNVSPFSKYGNSVSCVLPMPSDNIIYELNNSILTPKYRFVFGNDNLENIINNSKSIKQTISKINEYNLPHNLNSYFENEQIIYFAVVKGENVHQIIYDKANKTSYTREVGLDILDQKYFPIEYQGDKNLLIHMLMPFFITGHELENYLPEDIKRDSRSNGNPVLILAKVKEDFNL